MAQGIEIERKFLVVGKPDRIPDKILKIRQGYIARENGNTVRIREQDGDFILSIKTQRVGDGRNELQYNVSADDGEMLFSSISHHAIVKTREIYALGNHTWEVDFFDGANKGLVIAEVELNAADEHVAIPDWIGPEVTGLSKFYNANIASMPFGNWRISYQALIDRLSE